MLKSSALELYWSQKLSCMGMPLLVSSRVLRSQGLGQVDLAFLNRQKLILIEVKSSRGLGISQRERLINSSLWINSFFDKEIALYVAVGKKEFLPFFS